MPPPPDTRAAQQSDRQLLTAWLLLLAEEDNYGWALLRELTGQGISADPATVYRRLRNLECDELLVSRWATSDSGPKRRVYRATSRGQVALGELAREIREVRDLHACFQHACRGRTRGTAQTPDDADAARAEANGEPPARETAGGPPSAPVRLQRELLAAWLLLLLDDTASYGYELRRRLEGLGVDVDPSGMYRVLTRLEREGWLESRWMAPADGPPRHLYRLTRRGRRNLGDVAGVIARIHDAHHAFIEAYARSHRLTS